MTQLRQCQPTTYIPSRAYMPNMLHHALSAEYGTPDAPYYVLSAPTLSNTAAKRAIVAYLAANEYPYAPRWRHLPDGRVYVVYCPSLCPSLSPGVPNMITLEWFTDQGRGGEAAAAVGAELRNDGSWPVASLACPDNAYADAMWWHLLAGGVNATVVHR